MNMGRAEVGHVPCSIRVCISVRGNLNKYHRAGSSHSNLWSHSSGDKVSQGWFPLRPFSLVYRQLSPPRVPPCSHGDPCVSVFSSPLLIRTPVLWEQGPPVTSFHLQHLHHLLKSHLYLPSPLGSWGRGFHMGI